MSDDGFGPHAVRRLQEMNPPAGVDIHDLGTSALDALPDVEGREFVIVIDAVKGGGAPGSIYRFNLGELKPGPAAVVFSLHSLNLLDAARLWELQLGSLPEIIVFGVEPASTGIGTELTPMVAAALPDVCRLVLAEVRGRLE
jgi:hydrogenase maturation protease